MDRGSDMSDERSINHWTDLGYKQRITIKQWRKILLDGDDTFIG